VNVTADFFLELRDADPRLQNSELDTPFHVAAKSSNPNTIIHLLTTFRPTNAGWDVDRVDENRVDKAATLLSTCAVNGNAEAVALLIRHGADVSRGVLHDIIITSVKNPEMTEKFLAVYQAVVDNVVTWRCPLASWLRVQGEVITSLKFWAVKNLSENSFLVGIIFVKN